MTEAAESWTLTGSGGATPKAAIASALHQLIAEHDRGVVYIDATRLSAPMADLSSEPDIVVVLDASLMRTIRVTAGLKKHGVLLVNSDHPVVGIDKRFEGRTATVDATGIALTQGLGTKSMPIVNTAILGALARVTGIVSLDAVVEAIVKFVPAKIEANAEAAKVAYREVQELQAVIH